MVFESAYSAYVLSVLYYLGPFLLVPLAILTLKMLWYRYKRMSNAFGAEPWVIIEVILPKEIFRSPRSMEVIFGAFNQGYEGTWWSKFAKGSLRTWFSLEMVSLEGQVHFYIRSLRLFKHLIEAQIYAQYGDVEIREVPDYFGIVRYGQDPDWDIFCFEEKLAQPDPYPIRTYVDFGLDKEGVKEEYKTDPITPVIEYLGSLGPNQYAFIQIMVQATRQRYKKPGTWFGHQDWKDEGKDLIKKMTGQDKKPKPGEFNVGTFKLSPGEIDIVKAVERSVSKIGFDCGIRMVYAAKKSDFSLAQRLAIGNLFAQYNTLNLNGFKHSKQTADDSVLKGWLGLTKKKVHKLKVDMQDAYRLRSYFYAPYTGTPFVLNTEELATIFHFPGGVITTGGLTRIESKKSEPPANLPI